MRVAAPFGTRPVGLIIIVHPSLVENKEGWSKLLLNTKLSGCHN